MYMGSSFDIILRIIIIGMTCFVCNGENIDELYAAMRKVTISDGPMAVVAKRKMCPGTAMCVLCAHVYVCMCVQRRKERVKCLRVCVCLCVCVYRDRKRERARERDVWIFMNVCIFEYMYMHVHVCYEGRDHGCGCKEEE